MRKFLSFSILNCFLLVAAQAQNIPDVNFANAIRQQCPACINSSNSLTNQAIFLSDLDVRGQNISNLSGVQGFTSLVTLDCGNNLLTDLPVLPSGLSELKCDSNQLNYIHSFPNGLRSVYCGNNQLTELPEIGNSLTDLICDNNQLIILPNLPAALINLDCANNQLSNLPALPSSLITLYCGANPLTTLPALPNSLRFLNAYDNQLVVAPTLPPNLDWVNFNNNPNLNCLPILPNSLVSVVCFNTNITCIPNLPPQLTTNLPLCDANNDTNNCLLASAVDNNTTGNQFAIFPNPNKGIFSLRFAENVDLENANLYIYNYLGELITQQRLQNANQNIIINNLPAATYIVKVQTANATFVQKMSIE